MPGSGVRRSGWAGKDKPEEQMKSRELRRPQRADGEMRT